SRIVWHRQFGENILREHGKIDPDSLPRLDPIYFASHKAKIHLVVPEEKYVAIQDYLDESPLEKECAYRVRVTQRNGQMAWSSPIWVSPS
ncbi:MAG: hypothetical protein JKX85_03225, partial [Phycisphaeraceae bacterium]|nr:hypothetical protein [Phycisphaeraceae bacterium]